MGQFPQALIVADAIKEEYWVERSEHLKIRALVAIAGEYAQMGQFSQALDLANAIRVESRKASVLANIALEFAKTEHPPSESDVAILWEIVHTVMPMEKIW